MTRERINDLESRIFRRASADDVHDAACTLIPITCNMESCLRWLATVVTGPGGWPRSEVQQIAHAAADAKDWKELRDRLQARRQRPLDDTRQTMGSSNGQQRGRR